MRLCYGCADPECGDNDKIIMYKGVECFTCKQVPADQMRFYSSENMARLDLRKDENAGDRQIEAWAKEIQAKLDGK